MFKLKLFIIAILAMLLTACATGPKSPKQTAIDTCWDEVFDKYGGANTSAFAAILISRARKPEHAACVKAKGFNVDEDDDE